MKVMVVLHECLSVPGASYQPMDVMMSINKRGQLGGGSVCTGREQEENLKQCSTGAVSAVHSPFISGTVWPVQPFTSLVTFFFFSFPSAPFSLCSGQSSVSQGFTIRT